MDGLTEWLSRSSTLMHGACVAWAPAMAWALVGADALCATACLALPLTLGRRLGWRVELPQRWPLGLAAAFLAACGASLLLDIAAAWQPDPGLLALSPWAAVGLALAAVAALGAALVAETGRRQAAEQRGAEAEQHLALTLASIEAGFIATDVQGHVSRMNAVAERITGWSQADAMGRSLWQVFDRSDRPAGPAQRNPVAVMQAQGVCIEQPQAATALARDGRSTPVEVRAALTCADDGHVRGLALVFRDMTRLNQAETERQRLAAIVASSLDAIIGKTLDGTITTWNAAAEAMFGYTAEQAVGGSILRLIPPEHEVEEARILAELAQGRLVAPFETVRITRDGRRIPVSVTASPIRDASGRIVGASKIARDITQRREADAARLRAGQLEAENRQIQAASRLKSQFLANMSHELRTPLNAIIGFADLLYAGTVSPDSPKHRRFLGHIGASGRHLLQLINDVLDLSKVEAGKFEFRPEPVSLQQLADEARDMLGPAAAAKQLLWRQEIDPTLDGLVLDAERFTQVLCNYLSNAIKFTAPGGCVSLRACAAGAHHFRLEVEDTGIGIAEHDLGRLFVEFQQLDAGHGKQHQGTGLGLALTRRLVQAQGGRVGVRSTPGRGSVFYLEMPRAPGRAADGAPRWLVIEDDDRLRQAVLGGLQRGGFQADGAASAAQALAQAQARPYDAITLDLQLPDRQGLGALALIRCEGPSRESPVRVLTMPAGARASATFAIANLMAKPLRTGEVVAAMARLATPPDRRLRVMVIDDDPLALALMSEALGALHIDALCRPDARAALAEIARQSPDALVLDLMMPGFDGFATLHALRGLPGGQALPVFIWTSMLLTDEEFDTLAQSAQVILAKGGGALQQVFDLLGRWRPQAAPAEDGGR